MPCPNAIVCFITDLISDTDLNNKQCLVEALHAKEKMLYIVQSVTWELFEPIIIIFFFLLGCIGWLMPPGTFFCLCYGSSDIGINMQRCLHSHYRSGFAKPMFGLQSGVTYFTASPWHGCFRTARTSHKARQHLIAPTHEYPSSNLLHYLMSTLCSWVGPLSSSNSAFIFI